MPVADAAVLSSKRAATRYRILVEVARRQPAVSQREIADAIGVTAQAVSENLGELAAEGLVAKRGRGRYEVTTEGVDWLLSATAELRAVVDHVSADVVGEVETATAIAAAPIDRGDAVSLSMREGVLRATPGAAGSHTAVAVTDAEAGTDVGVTEFEGLLEYDPGAVTVLVVPGVREGGSRALPPDALRGHVVDADLLAVAGTEALATARAADLAADVRFGTEEAVPEAAMKGLDVVLVAETTTVSAHTGALRERSIGYEIVEAGDESVATGADSTELRDDRSGDGTGDVADAGDAGDD